MQKTNNYSEINKLLIEFQKYYSRRDKKNLFKIIKLFENNNVELIGTTSEYINSSEWCNDLQSIEKIILDDWKYWGELKLSLDNVKIDVFEKYSYASMYGRLYKTKKTKNIEQLPDGNILFCESKKSNSGQLYYPIRITVLLKKETRWKIQKIHFSHPVNEMDF